MDKEEVSKLIKYYSKKYYIDIAQIYSADETLPYYEQVADVVSKRFGKFISRDEILENLQSKGIVFSYYQRGFLEGEFDKKNFSIGISHFLNRLSQCFLHECTHKIGYANAHKIESDKSRSVKQIWKDNEESFYIMNKAVKEAGTELVSAKSLSNGYKRTEVVNDLMVSTLPEKVESYYLTVSLVNQLNNLVGGEVLEQSILQGRDKFTARVKEEYGEDKASVFIGCIDEIYKDLDEYSRTKKDSTDYKANRAFLNMMVSKFQDDLLETEFDKRYKENVDSLESGKEFLQELVDFSDFRVKFVNINENNQVEYKDDFFDEYFRKKKNQIERAYGETGVNYNIKDWLDKYEERPLAYNVDQQERRDLLNMSKDFAKINEAPKGSGLFGRIFGKREKKQQKLPTPTLENTDYWQEVEVSGKFENTSFKRNDERQPREKVK